MVIAKYRLRLYRAGATRLLRRAGQLGERAELLVHAQRVEIVPALDELTVVHANDADAGDVHRPIRGRDAKAGSFQRAGEAPPRDDLVVFGDQILDVDLQIG